MISAGGPDMFAGITAAWARMSSLLDVPRRPGEVSRLGWESTPLLIVLLLGQEIKAPCV